MRSVFFWSWPIAIYLRCPTVWNIKGAIFGGPKKTFFFQIKLIFFCRTSLHFSVSWRKFLDVTNRIIQHRMSTLLKEKKKTATIGQPKTKMKSTLTISVLGHFTSVINEKVIKNGKKPNSRLFSSILMRIKIMFY